MAEEKIEMSTEELIYSETEKRLAEMEKPDYAFPKRITKIDYILMAIGFFGSLVLVLMCMTGVIK